jgi:hypothetical protein
MRQFDTMERQRADNLRYVAAYRSNRRCAVIASPLTTLE